MPKGWYANWDFSNDLSIGGKELSFRRPNDLYVLVETQAVRDVTRLVERIDSPNISPRYYLVGHRGYGKSSLLNLMEYLLFQNIDVKRALPVRCPVVSRGNDEQRERSERNESNEGMTMTIFQSLLEALLKNVPSDIRDYVSDNSQVQFTEQFKQQLKQLRDADREYLERLQNTGQVTPEYVRRAFERRLEHLSEVVQRVVFLIDGLDKQTPRDVLRFFRTNQETMNAFITQYKCVFVVSAETSWIATLETDEYSGVKGTAIALRSWSPQEAIDLVTKRINSLGVVSPFTPEGLELLREQEKGNPRLILQYATQILHEAARQKMDSIGPGIVTKMVWPQQKKMELFAQITQSDDFRRGFERLRSHVSDRINRHILEMIYEKQVLNRTLNYKDRADLGITLKDEDFESRLNLMVQGRCLQLGDSRRVGSRDGYVELDPEAKLVLNWVRREGLPFEPLATIFDEFHSEIKTPIPIDRKESLGFDEIRQVFKRTPRTWMDSKQVIEALLKPPGARLALEAKYGSEVELALRITPAQVEKFYEQYKAEKRELVLDFDSGKMRWRGEKIDAQLAELIRHQDEIEGYEAARVAFDESDDDALREACHAVIKCALRRMFELVGKPFDQSKLVNVTEVLKQYHVDVRGLTPLRKILMTRKRARDFVNECGGRKIVLDTTEEYLRRLHSVINDQEDMQKSTGDTIGQEESETLEFKSTLSWDINLEKKSSEIERAVAKTIAAFMNVKGGTLIVGVDSKHNVLGLERDFVAMRDPRRPYNSDQDAFGLKLGGVIKKFLGKNALVYYHVYWHDKQGKKVATIKIDRGPGPTWLKGENGKEFYMRSGNESEILDSEETAKYIKQHWPDWNP